MPILCVYNLIILVIEDYGQQLEHLYMVYMEQYDSDLRNSCLVCKSSPSTYFIMDVLLVGIRDDCLTSLAAETKTGQARATGSV